MIYESPQVRGDVLVFPAIFDNYEAGKGYQPSIRVQNLNEAPVEISVTYVDDWMGTVTDEYTIPVSGQYKKYVRQVTGDLYSWQDINFNGMITVEVENVDQKIAGVLYNEYVLDYQLKSMNLYWATRPRTELYFPYIYDGFGDSANYYSIYNPSIDSAVNCSIAFYTSEGDTGSGPVFTDEIAIEPGRRHISTPSWARYGELGHDFAG
jgi:hypothetical protein